MPSTLGMGPSSAPDPGDRPTISPRPWGWAHHMPSTLGMGPSYALDLGDGSIICPRPWGWAHHMPSTLGMGPSYALDLGDWAQQGDPYVSLGVVRAPLGIVVEGPKISLRKIDSMGLPLSILTAT